MGWTGIIREGFLKELGMNSALKGDFECTEKEEVSRRNKDRRKECGQLCVTVKKDLHRERGSSIKGGKQSRQTVWPEKCSTLKINNIITKQLNRNLSSYPITAMTILYMP